MNEEGRNRALFPRPAPSPATKEWEKAGVVRFRTSDFGLRTSSFPLSSRAFSLLEVLGVLVVIAFLAAILLPVVIRRVDFAAWSSENAALSSMATALKQYVVQSNSIPDQTTWVTAIASQLNLASANVATTPRNYSRAFLIDTSGWLGTALASGPWTQPPGGTVQAPGGLNAPTNSRLMIVSTIGGPPQGLPVSSGKPSTAAFNDIWNTSLNAKPSTWKAWSGKGEDLVIQRINLDPLFHHVILVNGSIGGLAISPQRDQREPDASGRCRDEHLLPGRERARPVHANTNLMAQEIIRNDLSRVFEYGVWRDQLYGGTTNGVLVGLDLLAASFFTSAPASSSGTTPQAFLGFMTSYMNGYMSWAAMNFSYNGTGSYTDGSFAPYNETIGALNNIAGPVQ